MFATKKPGHENVAGPAGSQRFLVELRWNAAAGEALTGPGFTVGYAHASCDTSVEAEQPTRKKLNAEMLVGVSAVIIGLCALGVSLYETSLMREEQRAAVMPLLELGRSFSVDRSNPSAESSSLSLHASNVGIGPARIVDFLVTVDGNPQPSWNTAMRELLGRDRPVSYMQSTISGRTIPPDRVVTMMDLNDTELTAALLAEFHRLDFEACYCSVFGECWVTKYSELGTGSEVESCRRSDASFTE